MAVAAKIRIDLEAHTAQLQQGMSQATNAIKRMDAGMSGSVAKGMAAFSIALAGITAALMVLRRGFQLVGQSMSRLDETQKLADRIDATADSLTALSFAAEQGGSSWAAISKGLENFQKNVSMAAEGTGEQADALKELGLNAEAFEKMPLEEKLGKFADALNTAATQGDKLRIAQSMFGRAGKEMLNMLAGGSAGLNDMAEQANRMGLNLGTSRKGVEQANDAMNTITKTLKGLLDMFTSLFAPVISAISMQLKLLLSPLVFIGRAIQAFMEPLMEHFRNFAAELNEALSPIFRSLGVAGDSFMASIGEMAKMLMEMLKPAFDVIIVAAEALASSWVLVFGVGEKANGLFGKLTAGEQAAERAAIAAAAAADEHAKAMEREATAAIAAQDALMKRGESITKSLRTPTEIFKDAMAELQSLVKAGALSWETYQRGVKKAAETLRGAAKDAKSFATAGVGAVTRASVAGFSALHSAQREKQDADRRHRESVDWLERIENAIRETEITVNTVNI